MKIKFILLPLTILFNFVYAQRDDGTSMRPILRESLEYIERIEKEKLEIVRMEFDILSDIKTTFRSLHEGWEYGIIVFGDDRINDIDVAVYKDVDGVWSLIKKDTDAKSNAAVNIKPSSTALYRIDIVGYKYKEGFNACHYGLIIFHE